MLKQTLTISLFFSLALFLNGKGQEVDWMSWKEAVHANQNKEAKKLFVDVYTDWCGWCKKMDKTTFSDPDVASYLNENYYPVKFDAERKDPLIMGDDTLKMRPKFGKKGTHELAIQLMKGKASYPTVVFLNEDLQLITPIPGYRKAEQMEAILTFFGEDHHKKDKDINKFIKNYPNNGKEKKRKEKSEKEKTVKQEASDKGGTKKTSKKKEREHGDRPIDWMGWEEMVDTQKEDPGLVFIDIYTHWCGPCKLLDKKTFRDQKVASFINEHFHPVKMNAEMKDTIRFRGKNYKNTKPGFEKSSRRQRGKPHELPLKLVDGRLAYPTMIVLNEKMGRAKMIRGYKNSSQLLKALRPMVEKEKE